jgi:hypothetical protein
MPQAGVNCPGWRAMVTMVGATLASRRSTMKIAQWGLMILLATPSGIAYARPQQDSLADAARLAQEQKKDQPKAAAKVWDNDNIPSTSSGISVVGQAAPPGDNSATPADQSASPVAATTGNGSAEPVVDKSALAADLNAAKAQVDSLKTDLDIMQRKFVLDQQMYMSKPEYSSDKAGAAAMKAEQDDIDAKQQAIADAQKSVADLQAKLDAANSDTANQSK